MDIEMLNKARELHKAGLSYRKIATIIGSSYGAVVYNLNDKYKAHHKIHCKEYRKAHKEELKALHVAYYKAHKEELKTRRAAYYKAHREEERARHAAYRATHKEEIKARNATYYRAHREELKARQIAYNNAHKEKMNAIAAAWHAKHRDKRAAYNAARRALLANALASMSATEKAKIDEIYYKAANAPKVRCYLCGKLIPKGHRHVDHIVPLSKGGKHVPSNLAIICDKCNLHKATKLPQEIGLLL